jgi:hypothetical protein
MPAIVPVPIFTSPRRWLHYGILRTIAINQMVLVGYAVGVPIQMLHECYTEARGRYVRGRNS